MRTILLVTLLLSFIAYEGLTGAMLSTHVAVHGPADFSEPEELVLEIGPYAFRGLGGGASVRTTRPMRVRLVGRETCHTYAAFVAPPGSGWTIRFESDGTTRVTQPEVMELGPGFPEVAPSECPQ